MLPEAKNKFDRNLEARRGVTPAQADDRKNRFQRNHDARAAIARATQTVPKQNGPSPKWGNERATPRTSSGNVLDAKTADLKAASDKSRLSNRPTLVVVMSPSQEADATAIRDGWLTMTPEFYPCEHNLTCLAHYVITQELNGAVFSIALLDVGFKFLSEHGYLESAPPSGPRKRGDNSHLRPPAKMYPAPVIPTPPSEEDLAINNLRAQGLIVQRETPGEAGARNRATSCRFDVLQRVIRGGFKPDPNKIGPEGIF